MCLEVVYRNVVFDASCENAVNEHADALCVEFVEGERQFGIDHVGVRVKWSALEVVENVRCWLFGERVQRAQTVDSRDEAGKIVSLRRGRRCKRWSGGCLAVGGLSGERVDSIDCEVDGSLPTVRCFDVEGSRFQHRASQRIRGRHGSIRASVPEAALAR